MDNYETVIGLEIHLQLLTESKIFCADSATFGGLPNSHISAISLAHPGTLPRLNEKAVAFAVKLGLALGCQIARHQSFDRKNYFYPDLPKGYQLTQNEHPICVGGNVTFKVKNENKTIRLHHIHLEEDAGKLIHDRQERYSLIDYNRAGVALLEIVTEPDFRDPEEVAAFMLHLRKLARWLEISDGNMEEGSLRCDCNVSVRKLGDEEYGERCEIKNLNSARFARKAAAAESQRQIAIVADGGKIARQTLSFDPVTNTTSPMRDKEGESDYRYFADPDLMPIFITDSYIENIKKNLPDLPDKLQIKFTSEFGLTAAEAAILTAEKETAHYFLNLCKQTTHFRLVANLLINKLLPMSEEAKITVSNCPISTENIAELLQLMANKLVSSSVAFQKLVPALWANSTPNVLELAQQLNLLTDSDEDFLSSIIKKILTENKDEVTAYKKGKKNLIGFFMGEIMRLSGGKATPNTAATLLTQMLKEEV